MTQFYIDLDVESNERYDPARFMPFNQIDPQNKQSGGSIFDEFNSYFLEHLRLLNRSGEYEILSPYRPDIYSQDIFGSTDYWQILWYYNNISNIEQLSVGKILYYPSISDVETLYFSLKSKQSGQSDD